MHTPSYTKLSNGVTTSCPVRCGESFPWSQDLPPSLRDLVVAPVHFEVIREYEMQAQSTRGRDATNEPCFCEFRHMVTQLRSDDDEAFYEVPVYAEALTSWRLRDARWLVCRTTVDRNAFAIEQTCLSLSDTMPR